MTTATVPFTFINRITSAQAMGVSEQDGNTLLTPSQIQAGGTYQSPYQLSFDFSWDDLTAGFTHTPFNDWTLEGNPEYFPNPPQDWFDLAIYRDNASNSAVGSPSWGPGPRFYPTSVIPSDAGANTAEWQSQRLVAVAAAMIGYNYCHHHIPDWNPGPDWYNGLGITPTSQLVGQGVDCSDYSSWLYNYGLGIYLDTDVQQQGNMKTLSDNNGKPYTVRRVADAATSYADLVKQLQTGDLLYIAGAPNLSKQNIQQQLQAGNPPQITHVIMWLGDVGVAGGTPLVTDSHGGEVRDENGNLIPTGIQARPFNQGSDSGSDSSVPVDESAPNWYFEHFLWALRILPDL